MKVTIERFLGQTKQPDAPDATYRYRLTYDQTPAVGGGNYGVTIAWYTTMSAACDAAKAVTETAGP